jgi:YVTN family beta-propeller protein
MITKFMIPKSTVILLLASLAAAAALAEEIPRASLLVLNKGDETLAIVDPTSLKVVGRLPAGPEPHEVIASADGKLAFISNYGAGHTLSVVDLVAQRALPAVELGALHSPHGLALGDGKIFFTAEANKVIGRYDPVSHQIDWILGLGQNRTHMIVVSSDAKRIFTSNVNSDTISIIEETTNINHFGGPPPGAGRGGPPPWGPGNGGPGGPPPGNHGGPPKVFSQVDWNETHIKVGAGPEGFDVSPDGQELWAANSHAGTVSVINVAQKAVAATLTVPTRFANRVKFTLDGKRVLISDLGGNDLVVMDVASRKEIKRIALGGGSAGILMQPDGARAYVAVGSENGLAVIDLNTLEVAGHIASGPGPDGLAWAVRN